MKRKVCLIEEYNAELLNKIEKKARAISLSSDDETKGKMFKNTTWYQSLQTAEKSCMKADTIKKIHYKFQDEREMVEEYNVETHVLTRRAWKVKGKIGGEGKWDVEVGDPIPDGTPAGVDALDLIESKDQPSVTRRNTRTNLEWRIRNLPYPIETYSISANDEDKQIVVRTTNKKYFKKLHVPEISRLGLKLEQGNISATHKFGCLIITYKKPQQLLDMDKEWYQELEKVPPIKDIPNECKTQ